MNELKHKSTVEDIRQRFDKDVERFSKLETGQETIVDASLLMELVTTAALRCSPQAKRVLDIGCGAGNNTLKLLQSKETLDCDLLDLSPVMLGRANERVSKVSKGAVRTFCEDIRTIELPSNSYDIVLAAAVLHHLRSDQDWERVFRKVYDITATGGSFWITDMVSHEISVVDDLIDERYGQYLVDLDGLECKKKVFEYIQIEDSPRPLTYQIDLLRHVGFKFVDVLHKNLCFCAFGAYKS